MSPRTIPTVEDFTSAVVVDRFDDMINPPGLTNHLATAQVDHDVLAVRSLNVPPVSQGDCITGQLYLGGRLARSYGEPVEVVWRPDQVRRRTTIDDWVVETTTVCPPGEAGVVVQIGATNAAAVARELRLGAWIDSTVTRSPEPWLAAPPPQAANEVRVDGARRTGRPADRSAVSLQGLVDGSGRDVRDAAGTPRLVEVRQEVGPGEACTLGYLHMVGAGPGAEAEVRAAYERVAADVPGAVAASRVAWDASLAAMFTPGNEEFGGSLPVLETSNDALRTLYWWGAMGVLWFRRDNPASVLGRTYDTLMPRYWQTTTFIWDYSLSSMVHALLDPGVMRRQIAHWVGLDIDEHFGTEWLTGGPVGNWYSVNHYAMTRLVNDYLRLHGDHAFLREELTTPSGQTRSLGDHVRYWARAWHRLRSASGLADYGEIDNLLECVSTYVHEVASLNAANVWCLRTAAEISAAQGQGDVAADLVAEAEELLPLVNALYLPGSGYFRARQPDGTLVETRHCYDFSTVGTTIAADLPEQQRDEMVRFFVEELRTPSWMRALSPWDENAGYSLRADHQWNGAYPAWPADSARAAIALGHPRVALEWLDGLARTTNQGPPGQAHFVEEAASPIDGGARKTPPQLPYLIDWSCSSAGAWCELVIGSIFGVEVSLDGEVRAGGCIDELDARARLTNLVVQGRTYDVAGGEVLPH
ncbi:hypothetical protein MF406_08355 [Georgenia sp. TF02-10]|uniref:hypothetical protein n=1 Tax=Georgenia sp. TF02-10 TaxID=2917725 RepID=UPI001FA70914|nr:hypothetical protein [Georgenia sp. TF02-10]UNX56191.1 hypothetical protein MF406_08355 [Georgenia sp. TF02-10]